MRIGIREQLALLVLLCSMLALMVLALATWFQSYNFIIGIRLTGLSLTASLKAAQLSSFLLLYQSSVRAISTRLALQSALQRYNNGNDTEQNWSRAQIDLEGALAGTGSNALLVQTIVFPPDSANRTSTYGLLNVTGSGLLDSIPLPYTYSNGSSVYLGDPGLGYPPELYPNLTYAPGPSSNTTNAVSTVSLNGMPLYSNSTILLGPWPLNESFSLMSLTVAVVNNTFANDTLGWITIVLDARMLYQEVDSPEGLGSTGQILIIGPDRFDNRFATQIRGSTAAESENELVKFVLPPQSNATLDYRHSLRAYGTGNPELPFALGNYTAALDAWTLDNHAINNAGSLISTTNEQGEEISAGYATVSTSLVDWIIVFEQSHGEVVAPINHLRTIVIASVFSVIGFLLLTMLPLAHYSVAPIRDLRAATRKSVEPYIPEGSSADWSDFSDSHEAANGMNGVNGANHDREATESEARKEGFLGALIPWKPSPADDQKNLRRRSHGRRTFRIPAKVPERKHWVHDELSDLTSTFNAMSDELVMQYERLEERVKERTAELEQSKKAAEAANESKTMFIANISHELKTPLNGILGLCAVCMQENDIQTIRSHLSTLYKSGDLLLHLLTDLLQFSKNSIGQQLQIDEAEFRLSDLSAQVLTIFERQATEAEVDLKVIYQGTNDAFGNTDESAHKNYGPSGTGKVRDMCVWGDKNRILQVLMNFTSNGLKFTPAKGSVVVRVRCVGLQEHVDSRATSMRKHSLNSKASRRSGKSKASTKRKNRTSGRKTGSTSDDSIARPEPSHLNSDDSTQSDQHLTVNVAGGEAHVTKVTKVTKVTNRRRSMSPPPLNTKVLIFELEVEDTGPGIPDEQQQRIFEPFVQGDLGLSKKYGGTGLGLSICAQLADLMDGGITLTSKVGVGSTFMMRLPLRFVRERAASLASSQARSKTNSVVGQTLHDDAELARTVSPDPIPDVDGPTTPALADVPRIVGFTQPYLAKDSIVESPKKKLSLMKKAEKEASQTGRKVRVLVAEDNPVNQQVVTRLLQQEDFYDITVAKDGQEALDLVRQSMESGDRFNLVFMDVQMPICDGIDSTKAIRGMGFNAPIIALTAFADEEKCIASGMDYFLPKPIRRPALRQVLKKYCPTIAEEEDGASTMLVPRLRDVNANASLPPPQAPLINGTDSGLEVDMDLDKQPNSHVSHISSSALCQEEGVSPMS